MVNSLVLNNLVVGDEVLSFIKSPSKLIDFLGSKTASRIIKSLEDTLESINKNIIEVKDEINYLCCNPNEDLGDLIVNDRIDFLEADLFELESLKNSIIKGINRVLKSEQQNNLTNSLVGVI